MVVSLLKQFGKLKIPLAKMLKSENLRVDWQNNFDNNNPAQYSPRLITKSLFLDETKQVNIKYFNLDKHYKNTKLHQKF